MFRHLHFTTALLTAFVMSSGPLANAQEAADAVAPEAAIANKAKQAGQTVKAQKWMVAVANPHAALAAANVLKAGGTAADAAIAAQAMLGLVEPQSSGLGGGAFLVHYNAATGALTTLDGRETAPLDATPLLFQDDKGEPLQFFSAVVGGRSVGTPGTPALLADMHKRWGKTPWADLLQPTIEKANNGFKVSPRLAGLVALDAERLSSNPATAAYFLPGGKPVEEGQLLVNKPYAATLEALKDGVAPFYEGPIARRIVDKVRSHPGNPGVLAMRDFANYQIRERKPVCASFSGHEVCGMGPPSSGGLTVGQILSISQAAGLAKFGPADVEAWRIIGDASRLAFADRGRYMADSDYVPMPTKGLLKPDYLKARSALLTANKALDDVAPGTPEWDHAFLQGDDAALELPSTSHMSIIDREGNAVSMTTTIENGFGSRLMVDGFLLNNELTDFSFKTHSNGAPIANRVEPGKRPRSSMAPTIIMKDGKPTMIIGSPGGSRIIGYVAKTIIAHLQWGMDVQQAISSPHMVNRFGTYDVEEGTDAEMMAPALENLGYEVKIRSLNSGLHGIVVKADGSLEGGADPRREGIVLGE